MDLNDILDFSVVITFHNFKVTIAAWWLLA